MISEGTSISDAFDSYSDSLSTAVTSAAGDLVEFEVRKNEEEELLSESIDELIEYLEAGLTIEEALEEDLYLDYASK
jgi:hypothetical protein